MVAEERCRPRHDCRPAAGPGASPPLPCDDLPRDLEEAALVDGATRWEAFVGIALPLAVPGVVTAGLRAFMFPWNEFLLTLVLTRSKVRTLPVGLSSLVAGHEILWGPDRGTGLMAIAP
jgi:multiple sugar transport system permease protein